jgi:hypothetical protein
MKRCHEYCPRWILPKPAMPCQVCMNTDTDKQRIPAMPCQVCMNTDTDKQRLPAMPCQVCMNTDTDKQRLPAMPCQVCMNTDTDKQRLPVKVLWIVAQLRHVYLLRLHALLWPVCRRAYGGANQTSDNQYCSTMLNTHKNRLKNKEMRIKF